jgi:hypothetical protein
VRLRLELGGHPTRLSLRVEMLHNRAANVSCQRPTVAITLTEPESNSTCPRPRYSAVGWFKPLINSEIISNPVLEEVVVLDEWTIVVGGRAVRYTIKGDPDSGYVYGVKVDRISVGEQFTAPGLLTRSEVESRFAKFVARIVKI